MAQNSAATGAKITTAGPMAGIAGVSAGKTIVVDAVVAKIAGIAAREVPGVHALGGGTARALGAIRDAMGTTDLGQGVKVEVGDVQVAADITIVVDYPTPLHVVATAVRAAVADAIERLVGMEVAEINVTVTDVYIASDDAVVDERRVS